jgi:hypothetical protein
VAHLSQVRPRSKSTSFICLVCPLCPAVAPLQATFVPGPGTEPGSQAMPFKTVLNDLSAKEDKSPFYHYGVLVAGPDSMAPAAETGFYVVGTWDFAAEELLCLTWQPC